MRTTLLTALVALGTLSYASAQPNARDTLPERVAARQIALFNRRDLEGFMALYSEDAEVIQLPSGRTILNGKAAIRAHYAPMFGGPRLPRIRVAPRVIDGWFVLEHEHWDDKPGNKDHAVWMYEIRAGLIRRAWTVKTN